MATTLQKVIGGLIVAGAALAIARRAKAEGDDASFQFEEVAFGAKGPNVLSAHAPAAITSTVVAGRAARATVTAAGSFRNTGQLTRNIKMKLRMSPVAGITSVEQYFASVPPNTSQVFSLALALADTDAPGDRQAILELTDADNGKIYATFSSAANLVTVQNLRRFKFTGPIGTSASLRTLEVGSDTSLVTLSGQIQNTGNVQAQVKVAGFTAAGTYRYTETPLQTLNPGATYNFSISVTMRGTDDAGDYAFVVEVQDSAGSAMVGEDASLNPARLYLVTGVVVTVAVASFSYPTTPTFSVALGAKSRAQPGERSSVRAFTI